MRLLYSAAVLLVAGTAGVRGQSALDGFDPNANGYVRVVVVQPDGKILIGGEFTTLAPNSGALVVRNHIARLNPDGTLDTAFNPNANDSVLSIALQADGKILASGVFTSIGGQSRNRIARLDPISGQADSFDPQADSSFAYWPISGLAVQPDGRILVAGGFTSIGGQARNWIARLDPTTGLADSFNPNANNSVESIAMQADGKILVGGVFTNVGGQARNHIARLEATTGLADSFNPPANDSVQAIVVQGDGKILVGGQFMSIGGQPRNYIARLDATTGLADSFNPNANFQVDSIAVQADGKILACGWFSTIGGQPRKGLARLDPTTGLADSFDAHLTEIVFTIAVQADGKILAGGPISMVDGQPRNRIVRLEIDGRVDRTLKVSTVGTVVVATAMQPDGKILIGGSFTKVLGVTRNNIARLNTDGTLDPTFNPNANSSVYAITVQADGKILAGGLFTSIGGQSRNNIARLDAVTGLADSFNPNANGEVDSIAVQADGKILAAGTFRGANSIGGQMRNGIARLDPMSGLADSFNPNANDDVLSIAVQPDGKILAGGFFNGANSIGGQTRNHIARLNATTGLADSFNPDASLGVFSIAVQPDGRILAGGQFSSIGGETRNRIGRLDATTGLADSFDPNANNDVYSIAVQADGKIFAGGVFTSIGGEARNRIARINPTTGLADSFDPNALNGTVISILAQTDGKILASGDFTSIGGQTRGGFARLTNDAAALQELAVTQTTITWTRGGSSPQLARVTFESSTDNVNYTFLGNGTAAGPNWVLTGLSLPPGENIYVRARGHYRGSYVNGSESITESVRHGLPAAPTPTPTATPTPTTPPTPTPPATPSPTPTATASPPATATPCGFVLFSENFDGVTAPALPAGWTTSFTAGPANCVPAGTCALGTDWRTDATESDTGPNSAFHDEPDCVTDSHLDTPVIHNDFGTFTFRHKYNFESGFDGGVVEISVGGGPFSDLIAAGGSLSGGYDGVISTAFMSPIGGRHAWTGNSGGYVTQTVSFPNSSANQDVVLRFRLATDCSGAGAGWHIDTIVYRQFMQCPSPPPTPPATPSPTTTPGPSPTPSPSATVAAQALNLSTRMRVQTGDNVGIGGFIITGSAPKHVVLRAIGAMYVKFDLLVDPMLELHGPGAFATITNDNWRDDPVQAAAILAAGLAPSRDLESAIDATLNPGPYTAVVRGKNNTSGVGLIEVYDVSQVVPAKLANISTRAFVGVNSNILFAGFILGGNSGQDRIVARGIGPSLAALGVPNALPNPTLELRDQNGALLVANNDWQDDPAQAAEISASGLAPSSNFEAAIAATLSPGPYTALVYGANGGIGVGLVEIYDRGGQ